jgi:hypothetical protein
MMVLTSREISMTTRLETRSSPVRLAFAGLVFGVAGLVGTAAPAAASEAELACGSPREPIQQMLTLASQDPDLKVFVLEGEEAKVYLNLVNNVAPRTEYRGEAVVGLERKDGSAVIGLLRDHGKVLCTFVVLAPLMHHSAFATARNGV